MINEEKSERKMMRRVYLDNASSTPVEESLLDSMLPFFNEQFGNASSIHAFGQQTKDALEESRENLAKDLGAKPSEIFFTSSGTESDNLAIKGVALSFIGKKRHLISSRLEHKAVIESMHWLQNKFNFEVTYIQHDKKGRLDLEDLVKQLKPEETALVSLMHANNEIGNINPIKDISNLCKNAGVYLHTDAVQSAGKIPIDVNDLGVDLMSIAGHKFHAPKGVGALYLRAGTPLEPLFHGGTHERNKRASTENVAFAVALSKAFSISKNDQEKTYQHVTLLRKKMLELLQHYHIEHTINGDSEHGLPHILNLTLLIPTSQKLVGDVLLLGLDAEGIALSSGSACTSGTAQPSHVLLSLNQSEHDARASVRISFSKYNTFDDVEKAANAFSEVLSRLNKTQQFIKK